MTRGARDVYYEELPRGRTRETVVRGDGTQSRHHPQPLWRHHPPLAHRAGRPRICARLCRRRSTTTDVDDWRDPGSRPAADAARHPGRGVHPRRRPASRIRTTTTTFLEQPPVERVERLYSIDEVKRSARIRDKTPRIDLDTLTFEFGSASIAESRDAATGRRCRRDGEAAQEEPGRNLPDRRPYRRGRLRTSPIWRCPTAAPKRSPTR